MLLRAKHKNTIKAYCNCFYVLSCLGRFDYILSKISFPVDLDFMQLDCYSFGIVLIVTFLGCKAHKHSQFKQHCQDTPKK